MDIPVGMVLLIQHGIWFSCPHEIRQKSKALIRQVMETTVELSVPLVVEFNE